MDGKRPPEWHTEQVHNWVLDHPEACQRALNRGNVRVGALALLIAVREAQGELPDVDFSMVDWETALFGPDAATR